MERWQTLVHSARFKKEVAEWLSSGQISESQAEWLASRYELNAEPPWYRQSGMVLRSVAILLGAMGLFLLISANWDHMPVIVRMWCGLFPLAGAYVWGIYAWHKGHEDRAELAFILASLALGANIALQAQIFHISAYFPDGILWWMIGSLPVIYFFRSVFLNVLMAALFVFWLGMQNQYHQFSFWSLPLLAAFAWFNFKKPNAFALLALGVALYMQIVNIMLAAEQKHFYNLFDFSLFPLFWATYLLLFYSTLPE